MYNSTGEYITTLDDVWRDKIELTQWESSTDIRLKRLATMEHGQLYKDGVLLRYEEDWEWVDQETIRLIGDVYNPDSVWEMSYEQRKEIVTEPLLVGILDPADRVVVDGYVFRRHDGYTTTRDVVERIQFQSNYQARLVLGIPYTQEGQLVTQDGRVISLWEFIDDTTIQIEPSEFRPNDEYYFEYASLMDVRDDDGVEWYYAYSEEPSGFSAWVSVNPGDLIPHHEYYMVKVVFRKNITALSVRLRSMGVKVY